MNCWKGRAIMGFITKQGHEITDDDIAMMRKAALAAEPYLDDDPIFLIFDGELTREETMRIHATDARNFLKRLGIPLEED